MQVQAYLNFDGRCEAALEFYRRALGAEIEALRRFKQCPEPGMITPGMEEKVMHSTIRIGDTAVMASDGRCTGKAGFQGISLSLSVASPSEAEKVFTALADGGKVQMPLAKTFFSPSFGMLTDRFGVTWMVIAGVVSSSKTTFEVRRNSREQEQETRPMRFMIIRKADKDTEAGVMPSEELLAAMGKYNEELIKAGALQDAAGLHASSKGARVRFAGGKPIVTDGPFAETKELIAGYSIIKVNSKEEAIEWVKRWPKLDAGGNVVIEIRQMFELEDFAPSKAVEHIREAGKGMAKNK